MRDDLPAKSNLMSLTNLMLLGLKQDEFRQQREWFQFRRNNKIVYLDLPDNRHISRHFGFWSDVTVYRFNLGFITLNVDHSDLSVYMQGVGYLRIVGAVPEFRQGRDA